jgi:hypothetical protein
MLILYIRDKSVRSEDTYCVCKVFRRHAVFEANGRERRPVGILDSHQELCDRISDIVSEKVPLPQNLIACLREGEGGVL